MKKTAFPRKNLFEVGESYTLGQVEKICKKNGYVITDCLNDEEFAHLDICEANYEFGEEIGDGQLVFRLEMNKKNKLFVRWEEEENTGREEVLYKIDKASYENVSAIELSATLQEAIAFYPIDSRLSEDDILRNGLLKLLDRAKRLAIKQNILG